MFYVITSYSSNVLVSYNYPWAYLNFDRLWFFFVNCCFVLGIQLFTTVISSNDFVCFVDFFAVSILTFLLLSLGFS